MLKVPCYISCPTLPPNTATMHIYPHIPLCHQERWKKSEEKAKTFERTRRMSFQKAKEMAAKSPNIPETIIEQIPPEKKAEIVRKLSNRSNKRPARYCTAPSPSEPLPTLLLPSRLAPPPLNLYLLSSFPPGQPLPL